MCISVDLPEPEEPMMAANSPRVTARSIPRSACTAFSPESYVFVTASSWMRARCASGSVSYLRIALMVLSRGRTACAHPSLVVALVLLLVVRQRRIFEGHFIARLESFEDLDVGVVGEAGDD